MFPAGVFGYLIATATTNRIQSRKGRRGISITSSAFRLLFALLLSSFPAFPFFLISFAGLGYGTGLTDTAWNAWASSTSQPNVIQGVLHGSFSVGCVAGPALATIVLRKSAWPLLYGLLVGLSLILFSSSIPLTVSEGMRTARRARGADVGFSWRYWNRSEHRYYRS